MDLFSGFVYAIITQTSELNHNCHGSAKLQSVKNNAGGAEEFGTETFEETQIRGMSEAIKMKVIGAIGSTFGKHMTPSSSVTDDRATLRVHGTKDGDELLVFEAHAKERKMKIPIRATR